MHTQALISSAVVLLTAIDAGSASSFSKLLPEMARTDFSRLHRLGCPILIFAGRYDYTTPNAPVRQWFDRLTAPQNLGPGLRTPHT